MTTIAHEITLAMEKLHKDLKAYKLKKFDRDTKDY